MTTELLQRVMTAATAAVLEQQTVARSAAIHRGLARARAQGKRLGRPPGSVRGHGITCREAALRWGCGKSHAARRMAKGDVPPQLDIRRLAAGALKALLDGDVTMVDLATHWRVSVWKARRRVKAMTAAVIAAHHGASS